MKTLRVLLGVALAIVSLTSFVSAEGKAKDGAACESACECAKDKDGKACGVDKDCCCTGAKASKKEEKKS